MDNKFSSRDGEMLKILKDLGTHKSNYPPELFVARRHAFQKQIMEQPAAGTHRSELPTPIDELQISESEYPPTLFAARRAAFKRQVERLVGGSVLDLWLSAVQRRLARLANYPRSSSALTTSLLTASMTLVVLMAFVLYGNVEQPARPVGFRNGLFSIISSPVGLTPTSAVICKQGLQPPLCLAREFDKSQDLTDPKNGSAKPAVAKDTFLRNGEIHQSAYLNDGLYGPGASWVSNSPDSWVKIDLGTSRVINTITFGRDRLGALNDGDPGRFIISIAEIDNVYADGNSNNDESEYVQVYDSQQAGFDGIISGPETVMAQFDSRQARFIKITFENAGTAVDEVQVFMLQPPSPGEHATRKPGDEQPTVVVVPTLVDTSTPIPTSIPTETPLPVATSTPQPTGTPQPTEETPPIPTETPSLPTDTPHFVPTETILPTDTPFAPPTDELPPQ